jgi:DNA-binding transcriptional regulator YhcF (GntR family)
MSSKKQLKHMAVADSIQQLVHTNRLRPGDRLPTEAELAARFGVGYMTVRTANDYLAKKGLLRREQGRGTFVERLITHEKGARAKSLEISKIAYGFVNSPAPKSQGNYRNDKPYKFLKDQFRRRNIEMIRFQVDPEIEDDPFPSHILDDSFPVIILEGYRIEQEFVRRILRRGKKVIIYGNQQNIGGVPKVEIDFGLATYKITQKLIEQGADHVWFVSEPFDLYYTKQMFEQYRQALADFDISPLLFCPVDAVDLEPLAKQVKDMKKVLPGKSAMIYATHLYLLGKEFDAFGVDLDGIDFVYNVTDGAEKEIACVERRIPCHLFSDENCTSEIMARMVVDMAEGRPPYSIIFKPEIRVYPFENRYGLDLSWDPVMIDMETGQELPDNSNPKGEVVESAGIKEKEG